MVDYHCLIKYFFIKNKFQFPFKNQFSDEFYLLFLIEKLLTGYYPNESHWLKKISEFYFMVTGVSSGSQIYTYYFFFRNLFAFKIFNDLLIL